MSKENGFVDVSTIEKCQELIAHQAVKIAELEEQLKNAIVPKFKIGQEVWFVDLVPLEIGNSNMDYIVIYENATYFALTNGFEFRDSMVFATKEEAQAKLEELGEKK